MKLKTTLLLFVATLFLYQGQAQCNGATFEEKNGIAVIEMETANLPNQWKKETGSKPFTGSSYIAWRGGDSFNNPINGTITYKVKINSTGTYRFIWRNKVGIIANHPRPSTEHNDSWLKIEGASDFFAQKGGSKVYPKGSGKNPTAHGSGGQGYFKVYASGTVQWTWSTNANDENPHQIFVKFNNPGVYNIKVGARSKGHFIDRMVLYKENQYSASQAQSLSRGQTNCGGGSPPPPPPPPNEDEPAITGFRYINANNDNVIGTLTDGSQLNLANITSNLSFSALANSDTGSVRMVLNGPESNNRIDNNVPYSAFGDSGGNYVGRTMKVGSYTLRAVPFAGDNGSGTKGTATTISFTIVNDGNDPPPPPPPPSGDDPSVDITNPDDGQSFDAGSTVPVRLSTDGNIVKHEIFVNGSKVDTDGSKYTPHRIRNVQNGNYTVRALVTDNSGATAEATVSFSVGNGNPPPPPPPPSGGDITVNWINAKTNSVIRSLSNGTTITGFNGNRNIQAIPSNGNTKSVYFKMTGPRNQTWTENAKPYALFGDTNGNYETETFPNGTYNLTVEAYSGSNRTGTKLESRTLSFTVANANASSKAPISQEVYVFPNPIKNGQFSVKLPENISGDVSYSIISTSGAAIDTGRLNVSRAGDNAEFNLDAFNNKNNGVYYLLLQTTEGASFTVPIVKQ